MMKKVLVASLLALLASVSAVSAETVTSRVGDQLWKFDLAKACQTKEVVWNFNGIQTTTSAKDGHLIIAGNETEFACPVKVVKKRRGSNNGGTTPVSDLQVAVHPDGSPVLNPGEVVVPVGNTNTGNTPVTGIGGTGEYTPVNEQPATAPDVEPVDTTRPEEVTAGFGPENS